jgi:sulfite oxidase
LTDLPPPPGKRPDLIVHEDDPLNAEPPRAALLEGGVTGNDAFYIRSHGPIPEADPFAWRIRVDGLVDRPLELSLGELRREFQPRRELVTLQCAGNRRDGLLAVRDIPGETAWGPGATGTAEWTGVGLAEVLEAAGLQPSAHYVEFEGADMCLEADPPQTFGGSIPARKAMAGEVLLALEMNGEPLPPSHGFPLRVIVPGYIGARSVKWLTRISSAAMPSRNYYQDVAYRLLPVDGQAGPGEGVPLGAVAVNCDILSPQEGKPVNAGVVAVAGYAFAGDDRHVVRVDVSSDGGGNWQQAELLDSSSPWAWRRWQIRLELPAGEVELVARAWDSAAATQPEHAAQLWNPKGYVNNAWARVRVTVV